MGEEKDVSGSHILERVIYILFVLGHANVGLEINFGPLPVSCDGGTSTAAAGTSGKLKNDLQRYKTITCDENKSFHKSDVNS